MPTELLLKLADVGAVGLMLALALIALVWTNRALLDFMKERIAFYEQGLIASFAEHDKKSAEAHRRQEEALERLERKGGS